MICNANGEHRRILGVTLEEIEQRKLEIRNSWDARTERMRRVGAYKRVSYRLCNVDDSMITGPKYRTHE